MIRKATGSNSGSLPPYEYPVARSFVRRYFHPFLFYFRVFLFFNQFWTHVVTDRFQALSYLFCGLYSCGTQMGAVGVKDF